MGAILDLGCLSSPFEKVGAILDLGCLSSPFEKVGAILDLGCLSLCHSVILSVIITFPLNILRNTL